MTERWKPIRGFTGLYEVSNLGNVRSLTRRVRAGAGYRTALGRVLKLTLDSHGYLRAMLSRNGLAAFQSVSRLVAQAFIPNPKHKPWVHHKYKPKSNNAVSNLEWATEKEDVAYRLKHGENIKDGRDYSVKLNARTVRLIRKLYVQGYTQPRLAGRFTITCSNIWTQRRLARRFGVHHANIGAIVRKESWKHL